MKTLFVPVDLSDHAYHALDYALNLAKASNSSKLIIFHHNPPIYSGDIPVYYSDDLNRIHKEIKDHLEKELNKRMKKIGIDKSDLKTEILVTQEAGAVTAICHYAKEGKADLIVMGSHGNTGLYDLVFGSVTSGVIEDSHIPVLAIPNRFNFKPVTKISFASTLEDIKMELTLVRPILKKMNASLEVVHVRYDWDPKGVVEESRETIDKMKESGLNLVVLKADLDKKMSEQIKAYMKDSKPDWMVMFPRRLSWFSKIFISSTSLAVLHDSRKPMLLIHKKEE